MFYCSTVRISSQTLSSTLKISGRNYIFISKDTKIIQQSFTSLCGYLDIKGIKAMLLLDCFVSCDDEHNTIVLNIELVWIFENNRKAI